MACRAGIFRFALDGVTKTAAIVALIVFGAEISIIAIDGHRRVDKDAARAGIASIGGAWIGIVASAIVRFVAAFIGFFVAGVHRAIEFIRAIDGLPGQTTQVSIASFFAIAILVIRAIAVVRRVNASAGVLIACVIGAGNIVVAIFMCFTKSSTMTIEALMGFLEACDAGFSVRQGGEKAAFRGTNRIDQARISVFASLIVGFVNACRLRFAATVDGASNVIVTIHGFHRDTALFRASFHTVAEYSIIATPLRGANPLLANPS